MSQDLDILWKSAGEVADEVEEIRKAVGMAPSLLSTNTAAILSLILEIRVLREENVGAVDEIISQIGRVL